MRIGFVLLAGLLLFCQCGAKETAWLIKLRNLKVLESKRAGVERTFYGAKIVEESELLENGRSVGKYVRFETESGVLTADFSGGKFSEVRSSFGYDVVTTLRTRTALPQTLSTPGFKQTAPKKGKRDGISEAKRIGR